MRFAAITLIAFATSASAGLIGGIIGGVGSTVGGIIDIIVDPILGATPDQLASCCCPADRYGDTGVHINQDATTYQCAYQRGACTWTKLGALVNTRQVNCPQLAFCNLNVIPL